MIPQTWRPSSRNMTAEQSVHEAEKTTWQSAGQGRRSEGRVRRLGCMAQPMTVIRIGVFDVRSLMPAACGVSDGFVEQIRVDGSPCSPTARRIRPERVENFGGGGSEDTVAVSSRMQVIPKQVCVRIDSDVALRTVTNVCQGKSPGRSYDAIEETEHIQLSQLQAPALVEEPQDVQRFGQDSVKEDALLSRWN
jgi:hypothetical protein